MTEQLTHEDAWQVEDGIRRARQITDERLRGLSIAARVWKMAMFADKEERIAYAKELDGYGLFSLTQLSKITRVHKQLLAKALGSKKRGGGRFEPESLSALCTLRKKHLAGELLSLALLQELDANGTSIGCACRLVGVTGSQYYGRVNRTGRWAA